MLKTNKFKFWDQWVKERELFLYNCIYSVVFQCQYIFSFSGEYEKNKCQKGLHHTLSWFSYANVFIVRVFIQSWSFLCVELLHWRHFNKVMSYRYMGNTGSVGNKASYNHKRCWDRFAPSLRLRWYWLDDCLCVRNLDGSSYARDTEWQHFP